MTLKLKNKLIVLPNDDKHFHEECDYSDLCNFPHPFRMVLAGPPNVGKTNVIYNILLHKNPSFERIIIFHNDPSTVEYQNIDAQYVEELPPIDEMDANVRSLILIEDVDYKNLNKNQRSLLDRYYGVFSTHHNISIILTAQDPFSVPANIRRMCSHLVLWKNHDLNSMSILSSRFNIKTKDLKYIFDHICKDKHDSLLIDTMRDGKYKLRKNIYEIIEY